MSNCPKCGSAEVWFTSRNDELFTNVDDAEIYVDYRIVYCVSCEFTETEVK